MAAVNYARFLLPGLVGAAVGVAYEGASWYMNDYYPIKNLNPKPEAFWLDPVSWDIFAKMNRVRDFNPKAYRIALLKTDSLLILEHALRTRAKPTVEDVIRAQTLADIALKNATRLQEDSASKVEFAVEMETLVGELERLLEIHVENIRQLCKTCEV